MPRYPLEDGPAAVPSLRTLGTGAAQAAAGTDSRLSDSRAPTAHKASHEPGGSDALTGLTDASIAAAAGISKSKLAALTIVNADVDAAAAIAESKLNLASDAAAGTASRRTIGKTALKAADGADTEFAFSSFRDIPLLCNSFLWASAAVASTQLIYSGGGLALNSAGSAYAAHYLDPADWGAGTRVVKVRVCGRVIVNGTAPAVTFTFGLYPVATWTSPGSNVRPGVATLGAAVASTTIATPSASTRNHAESAVATLTTADWYVPVISTNGTIATNSQNESAIRCQFQQV